MAKPSPASTRLSTLLWFCIVLLLRGAGGVGLVESTHRARVRHRLAGPAGRRARSSIARTRLAGEIVEGRIVKTKIHQPDGVH
jgi:hypothetical protein